MSILRRALNLDRSAGDAPLDLDAPLPAGSPGETESVRRIAAKLTALPPARARYVAAFAYVLGRAASATLAVSDTEASEMARQVAEVGGLDEATAAVVVELAGTRAGDFGATEDYLVTREFKAMSTKEDRLRLLRCCLLVMAADDEVDATESWLANRMAEELDIERPDLNRVRAEFHDRISGIKELRKLRIG
jgi:uncharacterized tellurite resistance protein B-like protein